MFTEALWYDYAAVHFAACMVQGIFLGFILKSLFDAYRSKFSPVENAEDNDVTNLMAEIESLRAIAATSDSANNPFQKPSLVRNDKVSSPATSFLISDRAAA